MQGALRGVDLHPAPVGADQAPGQDDGVGRVRRKELGGIHGSGQYGEVAPRGEQARDMVAQVPAVQGDHVVIVDESGGLTGHRQ